MSPLSRAAPAPELGIGAGGMGAETAAGAGAPRGPGAGAGGGAKPRGAPACGGEAPSPARRRRRPLRPSEVERRQKRGARVWRLAVAPRPKRQAGDRHALMRRLHKPAPDFDRQIAARHLLGRRAVVVAEPHAGNQIARVADEPGVAPFLTGAGLAGGLPARQLRLAGGAGHERLLHHCVHHRQVLRVDDAAEVRVAPDVELLAAGGAHSRDHMRLDADAAVGEGRVGGNHFKRRHFGRAERDRGNGFEVG